jgi:hypothetical protein
MIFASAKRLRDCFVGNRTLLAMMETLFEMRVEKEAFDD